jgi:uncharacterized membrane protein YphA (DoxX/SURF4 family)
LPVARRRDLWLFLVRLFVGGFFVYSGLAKGLHPADFLRLLRVYDLTSEPVLLNLIAAALPWFEVFCGLLLMLGVAVPGTALIALLMLLPFTAVVLNRALELQATTGLPFCAIRFDCGCGTGEVAICNKLVENGCLVGLCLWLTFSVRSRWALRHCWV